MSNLATCLQDLRRVDGSRMKFSESGQIQDAIPEWAAYLIDLGQKWPSDDLNHRRIALVSMPCDSPAAGLISLGAMTADLCDQHANDSTGHYDSLLQYANQYLNHCRGCKAAKCNPSVIGCGYMAEASGRLKSIKFPHRKYSVSSNTVIKDRQLWWQLPGKGENGSVQGLLSENTATEFYAAEMHPVEIFDPNVALDERIYEGLIQDGHVDKRNLHTSYSGLCLAGRSMGGRATKDILDTIELSVNGATETLSDLLAISLWSSASIASRIVFFNSRTESYDRLTGSQRLVVADGDQAFLKVMNHPEFQTADVIGVINRALDRDRLEGVGSALAALRQWYRFDEDIVSSLPTPVRGMAVGISFKRLGV